MTSYRWVPYAVAHAYEQRASKLGVSKVARSSRGFMRQYEKAGGSTAMARKQVKCTPGVRHQTWGVRRRAFVARHLASYRKNPTERRWLAMMMWAYQAPRLHYIQHRPQARRTRA